jgi:hypothetical protein
LYGFHAALLLFFKAIYVDEQYRTVKCSPNGGTMSIVVTIADFIIMNRTGKRWETVLARVSCRLLVQFQHLPDVYQDASYRIPTCSGCIGRTINKSAHAGANLQLVMLIANLLLLAKY